ncbi:MAG: mechanosensitive ion channel family protein [Pseudomonadota bacterium]
MSHGSGRFAATLWLLCVVCSGFCTATARAEAPALAPVSESGAAVFDPEPNPTELRRMLSQLDDREARSLLVEQLNREVRLAPAANGTQSQQLKTFFSNTFSGIGDNIVSAVEAIPVLPGNQQQAFKRFAAERPPGAVAYTVKVVLLSLLVALAVELAFWRVTRTWRRTLLNSEQPTRLRDTVGALLTRFLTEMAALFAFMLAGGVVRRALISEQDADITRSFVLLAVVLPRAAAALLRFALAPKYPSYRLLNCNDQTAKHFFRHGILFFFLIGLSGFIINFNNINGVHVGNSWIGFWLGVGTHLYLFWALWVPRVDAGNLLLSPHGDNSPREIWVARHFPYFAMGLVAFNWLLVEALAANKLWHLFRDGQGLQFVTLLLSVPLFDTAVRGLVNNAMPTLKGEGAIAERAWMAARRSYIRIGRVIVFGLMLWSIVEIWDLDVEGMASSGIGALAATRTIEILGTLGIGYLAWEVVNLRINSRIAKEQTIAGVDPETTDFGGDGGGTGISRVATVLPLVRWVARVAIVAVTAFMVLRSLGIDTTPLLAGAGVIGLAIGFGAQKLVADVVSGIFFLIDDAFRAGEYVDIEGSVGTVESISLRSMQLRHHRGAVHTIPYGEIPRITNYSRDWVIMKLRFTVPFETNLNTVKKLFKQIGRDLHAVPEFRDDLIQPFKSQGALEVDDVGIVVRGKFMAKPGKQFTLRKEILARVQRAFDENGIQFARKEVRVKLDTPQNATLDDDARQAIAAAAAEAAHAPDPDVDTGPNQSQDDR